MIQRLIRWGSWVLASGFLLYITHALPFRPVQVVWTLEETYASGRIPAHQTIIRSHCARSSEGLVVGDTAPGKLEWHFSAPGPLPTVIQPEWTPDTSFPSRISLEFPAAQVPKTIVLSAGLPLHSRAIDFSRYVQGQTHYVLRFEGQQAVLSSLRLIQPAAAPPVVWPFLLVLAGLFVCLPRTRATYIVGLCVGVGFVLRWHEFGNYFSTPLLGDAAGYESLAQSFQWTHPFQTGSREPFFIWLVKASSALFGQSDRTLRFTGLLCACGGIALTDQLGRAFFRSAWVGGLAAALYAFNPFAILMSVQGYQLECYTVLILALLLAWQLNRQLALGVIAGALCLTRIQFFFSVLPMMALCGWRFRWGKKEWLRCVLPFLILIGPYFIAAKAHTGSYFGQLHQHANYYQAAEKLGDPTRAKELPTVTAWQLLFGNHAFPELLVNTVKGYGAIFFNPANPYNHIFLNAHYVKPWNGLFLPFFWLGLGLCLWRVEGRWLLASGGLLLNILPSLQALFREPRLLFHVAPLVSLIVAVGMQAVAQRLRRRPFQAR